MRYVIMADGNGSRWNNYLGIPKHLAEVEGEPLLAGTVRKLHALQPDAEIYVTSHDPRYEFEGARRYEPRDNVYEIDRFTRELIQDDMCFLYGDTFYTDEALADIASAQTDGLLFFGNYKSIVAVRIAAAAQFLIHYERIRALYIEGRIDRCKGWQIYQSYTGQDLQMPPQPGADFIFLEQKVTDINTPEEYRRRREGSEKNPEEAEAEIES